jgi:hypothetical protein
MALAPVLVACAGTPVGETHWDEVTLRPGQSAYCDNAPCRVYFAMPPGAGKYVVTAYGYGSLGEYPAGQTVFLGSFWEGRYWFRAQGTDARPAWLWVGSAGTFFSGFSAFPF